MSDTLLILLMLALLVIVGVWGYAVRGMRRGQASEEEPPPSGMPDPNSPEETQRDRLERLEEMRAQGGITEEEYHVQKRKIQSGER